MWVITHISSNVSFRSRTDQLADCEGEKVPSNSPEHLQQPGLRNPVERGARKILQSAGVGLQGTLITAPVASRVAPFVIDSVG